MSHPNLRSVSPDSCSFSASSFLFPSRPRPFGSITTFLENDEEMKSGRFAAFFDSVHGSNRRNSNSIDAEDRIGTASTTTASQVTGDGKSHGQRQERSLRSHIKTPSPAVSPSRSVRSAVSSPQKKPSPTRLNRTRPPLTGGRAASEPRTASRRGTQRSAHQGSLLTSRLPLKHLGMGAVTAQKQKRQDHHPHHPHHHRHHPQQKQKQKQHSLGHIQQEEKKENRLRALSNSLKVRGKSAVMAKTSTAPAAVRTASVPSNASKTVPRASSSMLNAIQSGKLSQQKSFIESFTFPDDDMWVGKDKNRRARSAASASGRGTHAPLSALPSKVMRQQFMEDVTNFPVKDASSPGAPAPPLSVNLLQHVSHALEPNSFDKLCNKVLHSINDNNNNSSARSLHVWSVPPANVVLPKRDLKDYVWSAAMCDHENDVSPCGWMQPLQERARNGRRNENLSHVTRSNVVAGQEPLGEIDDDYHSLFNRGFRRDKGKGTKGRRSISASEVIKVSEKCAGVHHSLAAGSALLREPQYLLDSDALKSFGPISRHQLRNNENRWVSVFESRSALPLSFQPVSKRFNFVALSHPAKVLYTSILYLRTLGGFPTLLRINPLTDDSTVIGKEHCVELVFSTCDIPESKDFGGGGVDGGNVRAQRSLSRRRLSVSSTEALIAIWNKNNSMPIGLESGELVVVVRSVIAEKSVVSRFGNTEVVHVLPPLGDDAAPLLDSVRTSPTLSNGNAFRNDAVTRLLSETEASLGPERPRKRGDETKPRKIANDYGDLVVTFLMSAEASQLTSVLPEPTDLETMRYKIFALNQSDCDDTAINLGASNKHTQLDFVRRRQEQETQRQASPTSFEVELIKMSRATSMEPRREKAFLRGNASTYSWESLRHRFPPYSPVAVAESTLLAQYDEKSNSGNDSKKQSGKNKNGNEWELLEGSFVPNFRKLRLPRFHVDLADSIQYALHVQQQEARAKSARVSFL